MDICMHVERVARFRLGELWEFEREGGFVKELLSGRFGRGGRRDGVDDASGRDKEVEVEY